VQYSGVDGNVGRAKNNSNSLNIIKMGKSTNYDLPPGLVSKLNTFLLAQIWSTGFRGGPAVIKQQDYSDDKPCEVQYKQANLVFVDTIRTWIRFYQETVSKNL